MKLLAPNNPRTLPTSLLSILPRSPYHRQLSSTHQIPPPTPFVPDSKTFLSLIGRNLSAHSAKIPTWTSLFSLSSTQLRTLGVEPARTRRYLLWWRQRFRTGIYGIGGDLHSVKDAVAHVRVVEVPRKRTGEGVFRGPDQMRRVVVNVAPDAEVHERDLRALKPVQGLKVLGAKTIAGPFVEPVKGTGGSVAAIRVQEGMWEQRRGVKVDGGERRKVMVRRKRKLEEMKKARR
ncbi:MAG: hypothetical protein LQ338_008235 [Usnochroma carphineum]|nr:MAG: hypothetical protein LQ338_008235 [Usnochroma carphineum]